MDAESITDPLTANPCDGKPHQIPWGGHFAKSIIYGGLDAIVTTFSLVSSISGGRLSSGAVLVLGFANLVADGVSMGFGDFVSSAAERDVAASRRQLVATQVWRRPRARAADLVSEYRRHGMAEEDAKLVVEAFAKYDGILVDQKLAMEEGLVCGDDEGGRSSPWKGGLVTFASFLLFGCSPLLAYVVLNPVTKREGVKFGAACGVTAMALLLLGMAKAKVSGQRYLSSVGVVMMNGGIAASLAYFLSWLLNHAFGIED